MCEGIEKETRRHAVRRSHLENVGGPFRCLRGADPCDRSVGAEQPHKRETCELRLTHATQLIVQPFIGAASVLLARPSLLPLIASAADAAATKASAASAISAAPTATEATTPRKAAARGQSAARLVCDLIAVENLGAFGVGAGESGDFIPAVLVGQFDEDVEVAIDDLIGTRRAKEGSGNLKAFDRRELILAAKRLAGLRQQHAALGRILRVGRLPWHEQREKRNR